MIDLNEATSNDLNIFHRTGDRSMTPTDMEDHMEKIKSGFIPANGDMYGKGLYGADWNTQVTGKTSAGMEDYGPIIVHYVSKPRGYMIFDYRLSKRLFGSKYSLEDQLISMGAYAAANIPDFIRVLSDDLEDGLKYPRVSADRAAHFAKWYYKGSDLKKEFNQLKYPAVSSIKMAYETSFKTMNRNIFNSKIESGIIKGIVFAGNHDGNVIVTFPPSFKKLIYVGWCVATNRKITKPWDYSKGDLTADGINGQYQDGVGELLTDTANKSVTEIKWFTNLNKNTVASAIATTLKSLAWLKHSVAKYSKLEIMVNDKGETTIKNGKWIMGDCFATNFNADFVGGKFLGDNFDGKFLGGLFCKGEFLGQFIGGIYFISKDTKWNSSASASKNKKLLNVDGKVYPWEILDNPDKEWQRIQSLQKAKATGASEEIDDLNEFIVIKLGYACKLDIDSNWEGNLTNEKKFIKFKQKYDWLFKIRKIKNAKIDVEANGEIKLIEGELIAGTARFDFYGQKVVIRSGQVMGKNTFVGDFSGGIYDEGKFEGIFRGGIFNLDKAAWTSSAKMKVPIDFNSKKTFAAIYKGKVYNIPVAVLLYDNKKYNNFIEIAKVFSAGKWREFINEVAREYRFNKPAKGKIRGDDEQLELDASEENVPDWANDVEGINAAGIYAKESLEDTSMLNFMYEDYLNSQSPAREVTMFNESFGYYIGKVPVNENSELDYQLQEETFYEADNPYESEFQEIKKAYAKYMPGSMISINFGALNKDSICIDCYLAKDKKYLSGGYLTNDPLNFTVWIWTKGNVFDVDFTANSIYIKPDNSYMAYGRMKIPVRGAKGVTWNKAFDILVKSFQKIRETVNKVKADKKIANGHEHLYEKEFYTNSLNDTEQELLYQAFRDSYIKATGAAFSVDEFMWKASSWTFLGIPPDEKNPNTPVGGIAIRKQPSGLCKLTASFGHIKGVFKGFEELKQKYGSQCIWGFVTDEIRRIIIKRDKDFVSLPGLVVKAMEPMIKKLSGGEVKSVGLDGSISVETPAGVMKKYMTANKNYVRWLIDSVEDPKNAGRIPIPQAVLIPLISAVKALL